MPTATTAISCLEPYTVSQSRWVSTAQQILGLYSILVTASLSATYAKATLFGSGCNCNCTSEAKNIPVHLGPLSVTDQSARHLVSSLG